MVSKTGKYRVPPHIAPEEHVILSGWIVLSLEATMGVLPIMAYTGMLRPKTSGIRKGREICHLSLKGPKGLTD